MLEQSPDGSWVDSIEETAYGILILSEARKLATFASLRQSVESAIQRGAAWIRARPVSTQVPIWIEKVSYSSTVLTDCYVVSALKVSEAAGETLVGTSLFSMDSTRLSKGRKHVELLRQTPLFSDTPKWQLEASMIESVLFQPLLRARRLDIFPRKDMEEDRYFDIIPLTWTSCNNRRGTFASTSLLYEMMVISFLNYQADEFMEASAGAVFRGRTDALHQMIDVVFSTEQDGLDGTHGNGHEEKDSGYEATLSTLSRFVAHVSNHPAVQAASPWDRESVRRELRTFLQAHVAQNQDNTSFQKLLHHPGPSGRAVQPYASATDTFFHWVRTTSADHTSCPYSFSFVSCLLSAFLVDGRECFPSVQEKYLAAATCRHLATMCRMYNDYGSVVRDAAEGNVNSINFPEYHQPVTSDGAGASVDEQRRALFDLAQYERACLDDALRRLQDVPRSTGDMAVDRVKDRQMAIWKMFCDVTDLYGQIYVVRDIASRMNVPGPGANGESGLTNSLGTAVAT